MEAGWPISCCIACGIVGVNGRQVNNAETGDQQNDNERLVLEKIQRNQRRTDFLFRDQQQNEADNRNGCAGEDEGRAPAENGTGS